MRIKLDHGTGLGYVSLFNNDHNHEVLRQKYVEMFRSHRKMFEADVLHMNKMLEISISTPKIYESFANQGGGFNLVGFSRRDMYNHAEKQRKLIDGDAKGAFKYLQSLALIDPMMFQRYKADDEGRLLHLFWCDGTCRSDYFVFGDVLV